MKTPCATCTKCPSCPPPPDWIIRPTRAYLKMVMSHPCHGYRYAYRRNNLCVLRPGTTNFVILDDQILTEIAMAIENSPDLCAPVDTIAAELLREMCAFIGSTARFPW